MSQLRYSPIIKQVTGLVLSSATLLMAGPALAQSTGVDHPWNTLGQCESLCLDGSGDSCRFAYYFIKAQICRITLDPEPYNYGEVEDGYQIISSELGGVILEEEMRIYWPGFFADNGSGNTGGTGQGGAWERLGAGNPRDAANWVQGTGCHGSFIETLDGTYGQPAKTLAQGVVWFVDTRYTKYNCHADASSAPGVQGVISDMLGWCHSHDILDCKVMVTYDPRVFDSLNTYDTRNFN